MTFLYILLFIVCLSTLIMVHEAGHLITAKIFKVYCFEYAIGFGPRLLSFKRKKGETRFSLRAIPFGGFVSMYGESEAIPEEITEPIDESRSLNHIKKWKRAIIMTAGIMMNFVLALVIFFVFEIAFPAHTARVAHISVKKDSIAYNAGLRSKDYLYTPMLGSYIFYDDDAIISYVDHSTVEVFFGYDYSSITLKDQAVYSRAVAFQRQKIGEITEAYTDISYEDIQTGDYSGDTIVINRVSGYIVNRYQEKKHPDLIYLQLVENYLDPNEKSIYVSIDKEEYESAFFKYVPENSYITVVGDISKYNETINVLHIDQYETARPLVENKDNLITKQTGTEQNGLLATAYVLDEEHPSGRGVGKDIEVPIEGRKLSKDLGLYMQLDSHMNNYGTAVKNTFEDFGNAATLIYRGLGSLFTPGGWQNVGGIIAVGVSSTQVLQQNGFGLFLYYWAIISVNFGIVNLLPFPGLDGWHFLVTIVEGVTHKEIPSKVKNIISAIGVGLLLVLMVLILIKDVIMVI